MVTTRKRPHRKSITLCISIFVVDTELHDRIKLYLNDNDISEGFVDRLLILCPESCDIPENVVTEANER